MRILIISDAWHPQINGVVRTLAMVADELQAMGHVVKVLGPDRFPTIDMPTYGSIKLALFPGRRLAKMIEAFQPDALHLATEGPLGWSARRWAIRRQVPFSTSFHTKFPEYLHARTRLPLVLGYALMRKFHNQGHATLVATGSLRTDLARRGFSKLRPWTRGVDLSRFKPQTPSTVLHTPTEPDPFQGLARPIFLYVGRLAIEKNVDEFLALDLPGTKVVVGDGPQKHTLRRNHPAAVFLGERHGPALAKAYAAATVFVFPSTTDTFGLVLLESLACGTPIAAHPVTGPADIFENAPPGIGALHHDLRKAALQALDGDRNACRRHAERFSWRACAEAFLAGLARLPA